MANMKRESHLIAPVGYMESDRTDEGERNSSSSCNGHVISAARWVNLVSIACRESATRRATTARSNVRISLRHWKFSFS